MPQIQLVTRRPQIYMATVDAKYYSILAAMRWNPFPRGRPPNTIVYAGASNPTMYMHRFVYELANGPLPKGYEIDHRDHDGLNNQIDNLRCVTHAENAMNKRRLPNNTSGKIGVSWYPNYGKWLVRCTDRRGRERNLGYWPANELIEASHAYNAFVLQEWGPGYTMNP